MRKRHEVGYESLLLHIFRDADRDDLLHLRDDDKELINSSLSELTPKQEKVIRMRFAIGMEFHTQEQARKQIYVTRARVGQIEAKALGRLRHSERAKRLKKLFRSTLENMLEESTKEILRLQEKKKALAALAKSIYEFEISVRTHNCLKNANIETIGDLVQKSEQEMLRIKNFGRKCLNELKEILASMDLRFGMKVANVAN